MNVVKHSMIWFAVPHGVMGWDTRRKLNSPPIFCVFLNPILLSSRISDEICLFTNTRPRRWTGNVKCSRTKTFGQWWNTQKRFGLSQPPRAIYGLLLFGHFVCKMDNSVPNTKTQHVVKKSYLTTHEAVNHHGLSPNLLPDESCIWIRIFKLKVAKFRFDFILECFRIY